MRDNYDIAKLNPRKTPYAEKLKRQVTINLRSTTVDYFKKLAEETGIPYQNLIDMYLDDCVKRALNRILIGSNRRSFTLLGFIGKRT